MTRVGAILVLTGFAFLLTLPASVAAAKGYKPPKSSCWQFDGFGAPLDGFRLAIASKPSGLKLKDMGGTVKFYSLQGAISWGAGWTSVDGSGYVDEDDPRFEGHMDGMYGMIGFISCNIILSETGGGASCAVAPTLDSPDAYELDAIDCRTQDLDLN